MSTTAGGDIIGWHDIGMPQWHCQFGLVKKILCCANVTTVSLPEHLDRSNDTGFFMLGTVDTGKCTGPDKVSHLVVPVIETIALAIE